jgi:hypothetical protein
MASSLVIVSTKKQELCDRQGITTQDFSINITGNVFLFYKVTIFIIIITIIVMYMKG